MQSAAHDAFGHIDEVEGDLIRGWFWNSLNPEALPTVTINGVAAAIIDAHISRPDVEAAGFGLRSGFSARIPRALLPISRELSLEIVISSGEHDSSAMLRKTFQFPGSSAPSELFGSIDSIDAHYVQGWIWSPSTTAQPVVQVNGRVARIIRRDIPRADVKAAGFGLDVGFVAELPPPDPSETSETASQVVADLFHVGHELVHVSRYGPIPGPIPSTRRAAVVCWDLAHNPAGRAKVLVDTLSRLYDNVDLIGPLHKRFGGALWGPLKSMETKVYAERVESLDDIRQFCDRLPKHYDLVWICKPRLPALVIADRISSDRTKVILDIDDHELAFFPDVQPNSPVEAKEFQRRLAKELAVEPFGRCTTEAVDAHVRRFPAITVSNCALQDKYGGSIVRHARDESVFSMPTSKARQLARTKANISPDDFVFLFVGTPRGHKGLNRLAEILQGPNFVRRSARLFIFGVDEAYMRQVEQAGWRNVHCNGTTKFEDLPSLLMLGDAVALLQDAEHPISRYQLPSKISDALSAGMPVVITDVPPVADIAALPGVFVTSDREVEATLMKVMSDPHERERIRGSFNDHFSLRAASETLDWLVESMSKRQWRSAREALRRAAAAVTRPEQNTKAASRSTSAELNGTVDILVAWKQNDLGLYNRRVDSFIAALQRSPRVGHILCVEAPCSLDDLSRFAAASNQPGSEHRFRILNAIGAHFGTRDEQKVSYRTFIFDYKRRSFLGSPLDHPGRMEERLREWVESLFQSDNRILWTFPVNFDFAELRAATRWDAIVSDFVDDQTQFTENRTTHRKIVENYLAIANESDLLIFSNENNRKNLESRYLRALSVPTVILPNTFDGDAVAHARRHVLKAESRSATVIGYVGNMRTRIDLDLLRALGELCRSKGWRLRLIGPGLPLDIQKELIMFGSVDLVGPLPFARAIQEIESFSVAILPHTRDTLTESMHPLKIYSYLACGVPVVCTDAPNIDKLEGIRIAKTHEAFLREVEHAIYGERPRANRDAGTWDEYVATVLDRVVPQRQGPDESSAGCFLQQLA